MHPHDRENLVVDHLPLVGFLVSSLCRRATHLSRDDLASVGAIALITSADAFDPSLGVPFGAYARRRITGAFADELRSGDWAPRSVRRRIGDTVAARDALAASLGRRPTLDELSRALCVTREEVQAALADAGRSVQSLDETVLDTVPATDRLPEASLLADEQARHLRAAVAHLPGRMRYVIEQVFFEGRSVTDVATELGTTHSAVSQQKSEALRLLQDGLATHYADTADAAPTPVSRISAKRRAAYLSSLGASLTPLRGYAAAAPAQPRGAFASAC